MSRLPSLQQLDGMSASNRYDVLSAFARDTRYEIEGLEAGYITVEGVTPATSLKSARRRLRRIIAAADHFGLRDGPLKKPRVRVKAIGRQAG